MKTAAGQRSFAIRAKIAHERFTGGCACAGNVVFQACCEEVFLTGVDLKRLCMLLCAVIFVVYVRGCELWRVCT